MSSDKTFFSSAEISNRIMSFVIYLEMLRKMSGRKKRSSENSFHLLLYNIYIFYAFSFNLTFQCHFFPHNYVVMIFLFWIKKRFLLHLQKYENVKVSQSTIVWLFSFLSDFLLLLTAHLQILMFYFFYYCTRYVTSSMSCFIL